MKRLKPQEKDLNTAIAWYAQVWSYVLNTGLFWKSFIADSGKSFFTLFDSAGAWVFQYLSPITVAISWGLFFRKIYKHWGQPKEKEYYFDLVANFLSNAAMTTFVVLTWVAAASGAAFLLTTVGPHLLFTAIALYTAYALGKLIYHVAQGILADDKQVRNDHFKAAFTQALVLVFNVLSLVFTWTLGMNPAFTKISDLFQSMSEVVWSMVPLTVVAVGASWHNHKTAQAAEDDTLEQNLERNWMGKSDSMASITVSRPESQQVMNSPWWEQRLKKTATSMAKQSRCTFTEEGARTRPDSRAATPLQIESPTPTTIEGLRAPLLGNGTNSE